MTTLDLHFAHRFILHSQLLWTDNDLPNGKAGALAVIEHLGYVQVDTISVVERAHHHVLWSRLPGYLPDHLHILAYKDRTVFEYWSHAASYLPVRDYRFSLHRKEIMDEGGGFWRRSDPELAAQVLDRIRKEGALMAKDFEKGNNRPDQPWMIPAINQVIGQLFMTGQLMISGRKGFQKTYDLPEIVLPPETDIALPSQSELLAHLIRRDLRAHGLVQLREFGYLLKFSRKDWQAVLKEMLESGEVIEVCIEGRGAEPYFAFAEQLEKFVPQHSPPPFHILSPFDNLIIQRKRLEELFGFRYTVECYVPSAKRLFGYFSLPLLYGNEFVGQVDLKADRKAKVLLVKNLSWLGKPSEQVQKAFKDKLTGFAEFNSCNQVVFQATKT